VVPCDLTPGHEEPITSMYVVIHRPGNPHEPNSARRLASAEAVLWVVLYRILFFVPEL
jgi:hypothetical protein